MLLWHNPCYILRCIFLNKENIMRKEEIKERLMEIVTTAVDIAVSEIDEDYNKDFSSMEDSEMEDYIADLLINYLGIFE